MVPLLVLFQDFHEMPYTTGHLCTTTQRCDELSEKKVTKESTRERSWANKTDPQNLPRES